MTEIVIEILVMLGMVALAAVALGIVLRKSGPPRKDRRDDDLASLMILVGKVGSMWAARENGECCSCGHEWIPGEIIGVVTQAYVRFDDGTVMRSPGSRLACAVCVAKQRATGDLSIEWAKGAGLL